MYRRWISELITTSQGLDIWSPRAMRQGKVVTASQAAKSGAKDNA